MMLLFIVHCSDCFFSSRRRHTRWTGDWSSDVCSSDLWRISPFIAGKSRTSLGWSSRRGPERSEERRVGKECRSGGLPDHQKKKNTLCVGTASPWSYIWFFIPDHRPLCVTLMYVRLYLR